MSLNVIIDPGHGGTDSGAVSGDGRLLEKTVVLNIGKRVEELLSPFGRVDMTRREDKFLTLSQRANLANAKGLELLSIHCNAGGGTGFEVFTSPGQTSSDKWATAVLETFGEVFPDRRLRADFSDGDPDKEARFTVLTATSGSAILVECGFIDTAEGQAFLENPDNQELLALAIANGTLKANGLELNDIEPETENPPTIEETLADHEARIKALEKA